MVRVMGVYMGFWINNLFVPKFLFKIGCASFHFIETTSAFAAAVNRGVVNRDFTVLRIVTFLLF